MTDPTGRVLRLVLGDQLFPEEKLQLEPGADVFMAEDMGLCTAFRHHQQKIVLFLAAMRCYRDRLVAAGHRVHYVALDPEDRRTYEEKLADTVRELGVDRLEVFEIEDKPVESRIRRFASATGLVLDELESPMFLTSRDAFQAFAAGKRSIRMANFYKDQRRSLGVLMDPSGNPEGDRWSFDELNRKKLPKDVQPPPRPSAPREAVVDEVIPLVQRVFPDHPGEAGEFDWPVTREASLGWLQHFVDHRLAEFGPYEDAITTRSETVFHSMLSPLINVGLITPDEVVATVIASARAQDVPIQSLEGFIRQVIGWREFIRGVYREYGEQQAVSNFFAHERELADCWYIGDTGLPILDDTIQGVLQNGWVHHIPRLMVIANLMNLCEIRPETAHRWFMEMFVDSAEWVMGPNVYGMGLFSDGGVFATKPYLCGSNYLLKMSDYRRGSWCDAVDGLYWRFIDKHRSFFLSNPRLSLMVGALDRMADDRRARIFGEAEAFLARVTVSS